VLYQKNTGAKKKKANPAKTAHASKTCLERRIDAEINPLDLRPASVHHPHWNAFMHHPRMRTEAYF